MKGASTQNTLNSGHDWNHKKAEAHTATAKNLEEAERRYQELFHAEQARLKKKDSANKELISQMNKKLKLQERKLDQESQVSVELRKRYDDMKRKMDQSNTERISATQQYKDLF